MTAPCQDAIDGQQALKLPGEAAVVQPISVQPTSCILILKRVGASYLLGELLLSFLQVLCVCQQPAQQLSVVLG
jgi:hypothetical protein